MGRALRAVADETPEVTALAVAEAHMPRHSWWYGALSELLDRIRLYATPPAMKHCACPGCKHGFQHIPSVSR